MPLRLADRSSREGRYEAALLAVRAQLDLLAATGDIAMASRNSKAFVQDLVPRTLAVISRVVRDAVKDVPHV